MRGYTLQSSTEKRNCMTTLYRLLIIRPISRVHKNAWFSYFCDTRLSVFPHNIESVHYQMFSPSLLCHNENFKLYKM